LHRGLLASGLLTGALIRAAVLPLPGTSDVNIWKVWAFAGMHDLTGMYGVGGSPPERRVLHWQGMDMTVDYPPISLAELSIAGRIYAWFHPLFDDSRLLNAAVKLPGLVAEVLLVAGVLTWGRRRFGDAAASWTALAIALNPALILDGPLLGYLDPQAAIPAVAALAAAVAGPPWLAGAALAFAVLTKAQPIFVAPAIAAALVWRHRDAAPRAIAWAAGGGAIVCALAIGPYVARGAWSNFTQAVGRLATHDMMSAEAANVWWIATWALRVLDVAGEWGWHDALTQQVRILGISRAIALGYPNPRVIGLCLVAAAIAWTVWRMRRAQSLADVAALTGWSAFAYAQLAAQVHENHLYLALPFFTVAAGLDRRYRPILYGASAVFMVNLLLFYGLGRGMPAPLDRRWTGIDMSVLLACVSVGLLLWSARIPFPSTRQSASPSADGSPSGSPTLPSAR
jgi:hypothetical protein